MYRNRIKLLFIALLLIIFSVPVRAITSATLSGPAHLNCGKLRARIYHAFDLAYVTTNKDIYPTFQGADTTPINDRLKHIADMGYTHIQISPPNQTTPTKKGVYDAWWIAYKPLVCNLSYGAESELSVPGKVSTELAETLTSSENNMPKVVLKDAEVIHLEAPSGAADSKSESDSPSPSSIPSPVPAPVPSKSYYQMDLDAAASVLGNPLKDYSHYGVKITMSDGTEQIVGYRLGSDRYGSAADLATLIKNAKSYNLGIIADVVFQQIGWQNDTFSETPVGYSFHAVQCSGPSSELIDTVGLGLISKDHLSKISLNSQTASGSSSGVRPNPATNFIIPFDPSNPDCWKLGPALNLRDEKVQIMAAGYLQLLHDIGIVGIRLDNLHGALKKTDTGNFHNILTKSPVFSFGYGEIWDGDLKRLPPYGPVMPLEDFVLHYKLTECFVEGRSFVNMVKPEAIGNTHAVTFSVNHDMYPKVGTILEKGFYSNSQHPDNETDKAQSQLAIAYLCARRDGSPLILRFEDERDNKQLIQRSLAFRTLMEQKNAPHEFIVNLSDDILLIARQYGFVIINKGTTHSYRINNTIIQQSYVPNYYIPDGSYDDLMDLGSQRNGSYQLSSLSIDVPPMDAKFLVLNTPTNDQKSYDVVFTTVCSSTEHTDQICMAGNHPLLGNWWVRLDLLNGLLCSKSAANLGGLFPNWQSQTLRFPAGASFNYKFAISNNGLVKQWESGAERHYVVNGDAVVPSTPPAVWS